MKFSLEYKLKLFRNLQKEAFDSDGKWVNENNFSSDTAEIMLKLIDELEAELMNIDATDVKFHEAGISGCHLMYKDQFSEKTFTDHCIEFVAVCPSCGGEVIWGHKCLKCDADFIFKD